MEFSITRIIKVGGVVLLLFLGACTRQTVTPEEPLPPLEPGTGGNTTVTVPPVDTGGTPSASVHIVQKGEGLYGIARQYGLDWKNLAAWNGISPPYALSIGQRIVLTPSGGGTTTVTQPPVTGGQATTHTVQRGENLYRIALRYGLNYRDVAAWNNIPPPYSVSVGQQIIVTSPGGALTSPAPTTTFQPSPVPTPEAGPVYHTVQRGDTLYALGRTYNQRPQDIAAWNGISMNTALVIGQSLRVTPAGANSFAQPAPVINANPVGQGYYTVQRGDTLYSISRQFGYSVNQLANWNNLRQPYLLKVGQVLRVSPANVTVSSVANTSRPIAHVVRPGESLAGVANLYGKTTGQLASWNNISPPYTIQPGRVLTIYP